MANTPNHILLPAPDGEEEYAAWLEHTAGFILFEDVRRYAYERIDPDLDSKARLAAQKAIDDALYGVMMVAAGVSGHFANAADQVEVALVARHFEIGDLGEDRVLRGELDLSEGEGMCQCFHGWVEGDFSVSLVPREQDADASPPVTGA